MENSYLLAFLLLFHFSPGGNYETPCSSGERFHIPREGPDVCIPCDHGTFIAEENHFIRKCNPCTGIENPDVEVLVNACNRTHDAVILCTSGFYRRRARNANQIDTCEKCTECPFPARPCEGYHDTACCPPNHDAVMTPEGVFVCKERPIVCGAGQFFRTFSEECLPCPAGTFMSDHSHTYKDCLKCEELSENNLTQAVITRPCSRAAPTLFGCKAGYFRDPTQESLQIEVSCTPCRICDRRLTDCDMFHDAVCDDEDRMVSTAPTKITVSIGVTEDAEKRARGTSVSTDTLHSHEQNKSNQSQNRVTERETSVPADLYVYVVLFPILISTLVTFVCTDKPDTKHSRISVARCRLTTPRIMTALLVLLCVLFLICALMTTGAIPVPHYASNVCGIITVSAAVFYVIAVNVLTIRQMKPQVNEERRPRTVVGAELENIIHRQTYKLVKVLKDSEETTPD